MANYGTGSGYPPGQPTAGYPPTQPGYPPASNQGYPPSGAPGYPPAGAPGYPPAGASGYPPAGAQGYPPSGAPGYPPAGAPGYPPANQGAPPGGASYPPGGPPPAGSAPPQPSFTGETPSDDVADDPNKAAPAPSAPPLEKMDQITGYDNVTFSGGALPPPSYDEAMNQPPPTREPPRNLPAINEQDARDALESFVGEHCCYGKGVLKNMEIKDITSTSAFHYTLETFGEARSTTWAYEPFHGQPIDSFTNGQAPGPWDIPAVPSSKFTTTSIDIEVPHTASVKPCHHCAGCGRTRCYRCYGRGRMICSSCHGSGRGMHHHHRHDHDGHHHGHHHNRCTWCHGTGRRVCYTCHGHGQTECDLCKARGSLKCYIKLTITWTNHVNDHVVERTSLPDELIKTVSGQTAFEDEAARVWPVQHFPDQSINAASKQLVETHARSFPNERMLAQRQRVRIVPVTEVTYEYKGKNDHKYFVYGFEHKVHCPDYPQSCCWGCNIL